MDAEEGGERQHKEDAKEGGEPHQQPEPTEEDEADWASLYEDPIDYDEQRWIHMPLDQFVERNEGMKEPLPFKVWQRGPAGLPEAPQKPYATFIPKSDWYVILLT
jgi:hypothetical protein